MKLFDVGKIHSFLQSTKPKEFRIVKTQGKFIPQKKTRFGWDGIDKYSFYCWTAENFQIEHCTQPTLEAAEKHIEAYKKYVEDKKFKVVKELD